MGKRKRHGGTGSRLHAIWKGMKSRCYNKNRKGYPEYGGRGITLCPEWRDSFEAFRDWAQENGYRDDLTIDRIDNDGPYSPRNCRWSTIKEQSNNNRHNHTITAHGETHTLAEWSEITGISYNTIKTRLRRGVPEEDAVAPVKKRTIKAYGKEHTVSEWASLLGISRHTIKTRLRKGLDGEDALKGGVAI